ncbi:MAG: exodeoxyribonuclease VII large subunit [Synechococcales bacterium]|nr:exodeoxyribonuclease VII large subunit [Synechococcales bacterium]
MTVHLPPLLIPDAPLSVAGVTSYIQELLEQDTVLQHIWVVGEVSSANRYRSGLFFTLQDPDTDAAISCIVWNSQISQLTTLPEPGEQVIILGRVRLHRKRGAYQLNVWQSLPAGEGLRALRYRQLRQRLDAEGLFDPARKRSLPPYPTTIAVVTSPQAAAWGDIQRTLRRRYPGLRVLFSPALVQGDQAPASIVRAIRRVEQDGRAEVLVLSRGGGATEDMDCFNNEQVVRAIALCSIPIVAGIGHQRDESLADLAADVCVHTPTAAAEQAVPSLDTLWNEHQERLSSLYQALSLHLRIKDDQLQRLRDRLRRLQIDQQLQHEADAQAWRHQRLIQAAAQRLQQAEHRCQLLRQTLLSLDPSVVLQRGYAVVRSADGRIVRSADPLQPGQPLQVQLAQGTVYVVVSQVPPPSDSHSFPTPNP